MKKVQSNEDITNLYLKPTKFVDLFGSQWLLCSKNFHVGPLVIVFDWRIVIMFPSWFYFPSIRWLKPKTKKSWPILTKLSFSKSVIRTVITGIGITCWYFSPCQSSQVWWFRLEAIQRVVDKVSHNFSCQHLFHFWKYIWKLRARLGFERQLFLHN